MEQEKHTQDENLQLKKFQDPIKNLERQSILDLLKQFGDLSLTDINDSINNIFTDDCKFFIFSSTGRTPVRYCLCLKDFPNLYSEMQVQQRIAREIYIDLEKKTAFQFCNYKVLYQGETNSVDEVVAEVFTIKNNKISKYRAFFAHMTPAHGESDPFEITKKDKALAMVKKLNYALCDKPDLEKAATMLHENAKYKIWTWDSQKCFTFGKHDFVENFQNMQENLKITSIIPYEVYTESQNAVGTYVYHLEGIADKYMGRKYMWICTSCYMFDDEYKITRVSQQGELHLEGDVPIPFEVYPREKLIQKAQNLFSAGVTLDLFYGDVFALNCIAYSFGPEGAPAIGCHKGTIFVDNHTKWKNKVRTEPSPHPPDERKRIKLAESFVDYSDSSYDVLFFIHRLGQILDSSKQKTDIAEGGMIILSIVKFEHGKIVKAYGFLSSVTEPIPSPFDDPAFANELFLAKDTS